MTKFLPSIALARELVLIPGIPYDKAKQIFKEDRKIKLTLDTGKGNLHNQNKTVSRSYTFSLINKLSAYKMRIYNSFINTIGGSSQTDLHIYHDEWQFNIF